MIENRIKKLQAIEAQQKELEAVADAIRAELKADLEEKGVEELHPEITETGAVDGQVSAFLRTLDNETAFQLDLLIGQLVRAYEMQGFLFGANYGRSHT